MLRTLVPMAALLMAALLAPAAASAQDTYPTRPIRIIVPFPPGQAADIFARLLAERLSGSMKQQIVVENRAGGGGVPGIVAGKTAAPDGYTWTMGTSGTLGVNPGVYASLPYDPVKDFAPASNVFIAPLVAVANPGAPFKSLPELIAQAKAAPGRINFASAGPGTAQHMSAELFKTVAGIDLLHIPYKGSGPAMTDLLGGQVPLMFDSVTAALPHLRGAKLRALAVTTAARVPQLPEVPTIAESGVAGFEAVGWSGIVLPAATPRAIVQRVSQEIQAALRESAFRERIVERGSIPDPRTPEDFAAFIRAEMDKWARVAKIANVRLD
ncbi:MAG: Bug family tripartite tricarboxylate transporter substrate binding protein [Burkholderiales bacterium]